MAATGKKPLAYTEHEKEKQRLYSRRHYALNKSEYIERSALTKLRLRAYVDSVKESMPCTDCNRFYPAICMDFDHVADDKIASVADMVSTGSLRTVKAEMAKCELVCSNCHRIRTLNRLRGSSTVEQRSLAPLV